MRQLISYKRKAYNYGVSVRWVELMPELNELEPCSAGGAPAVAILAFTPDVLASSSVML